MWEETILNSFFEAADKFGDDIVFHYFDQTRKGVTYNELLENAKG